MIVKHYLPKGLINNLVMNSFQVGFALTQLVTGLLVLKIVITDTGFLLPVPDDIEQIPHVLFWLWVLFSIVGSVLILVGLGTTTFDVIGREIETAGLWLSGAFWLTVFFANIVYIDVTIVELLSPLIMFIACAARIFVLIRLKVCIVSFETKLKNGL